MSGHTKISIMFFILVFAFFMTGCGSDKTSNEVVENVENKEEPETTAEPDIQETPSLVTATSEIDLALLQTVREDHEIDKVQALLQQGAEVNIMDDEGETPLHHIAFLGFFPTAELLVSKGALINAKNNKNWTPLHVAAWRGNIEVAELLLDNGADFEAVTDRGETPLHKAAQVGHADITALLIEKGASIHVTEDTEATPLHMAANSCRAEVVKLLIEAGADVNLLDAYKGSPLRRAIQAGGNYSSLPETMELLIDNGAEVKEVNRVGWTLLHDAVFYEAGIKAVEILINKGVDINAQTSEGQTALDMAKEEQQEDIIEFLLSKGALEK